MPGSTVTYTLIITNTSNVSDSFQITPSNFQWPTTLSATTIGPLAGNGDSASVMVTVYIPPDVSDWDADKAIITFASETVPDRKAIATLKTTARLFGVSLAPQDSIGDGVPRDRINYPLTVTNTGGFKDAFTITASGGWPAEVSSSITPMLDPGTSMRITITVQIPATAGNETDNTVVTVTSQGDPSKNDQAAQHTTSKLYGVVLSDRFLSGSNEPGKDVIYQIQVNNTSVYSDSFSVWVSGTWETEAVPLWIGPLAPHASKTLTVIVRIPVDAEKYSSSVASLEVRSWADPTRLATVTITTYAGGYQLDLPMLQK